MSWFDDDSEAWIASITPRQHIQGVSDSCAALKRFLENKGEGALAVDQMLRAAVEMKFIHVGAALEELERKAPDMAERFADRGSLICLYHGLAEHHDENHDDVIWEYWQRLIPQIHRAAEQALDDMPDDEPDSQ